MSGETLVNACAVPRNQVAFKPSSASPEIEDTVKACIKHGCPCEFVLKDISTVSHKPENLIVWAQTVSDVLDQYYDKA